MTSAYFSIVDLKIFETCSSPAQAHCLSPIMLLSISALAYHLKYYILGKLYEVY